MKAQDDPALFGIVVYDGVEPIDIGGTAGVISMAQRVLPNIRSLMIAETAGPVKLAGGVTVLADAGFADAPHCDQIIVTGGPGWRNEVKNPAMLSFLRNAPSEQVASVCTGAMILGAAGVLDNRAATTRRHAVGAETVAPLAALETMATNVRCTASAIVDDGLVVTGGGVSLAIDATLYLIGRFYGEAAREQVAAVIEYDRAYKANEAALGHVRSARVGA